MRLPAREGLETVFLARDRLLAVLPEGHPLAGCARFPMRALAAEPFMLLEKGSHSEIADIFARQGLRPDIRFTTWDDYAIMSMVENGLGISILPELILRRTPYKIIAKELEVPAYRSIGFAVRSLKTASIAVKKFAGYVHWHS